MDRSWLTDRPLVAERRYGAWLVLLATLPLGLTAYRNTSRIGPFTWDPGGQMGVNLRTYRYAADLALAGRPFYDVAPPGTFDWAIYLYPPITVLGFAPFTLASWQTGYGVLIGLSVLASVAATALLVSYVESMGPDLGWLDVALIFAPLLLSTHAFGTIFYGNVNLLLALAVVLGLWALSRGRETTAGVAFGLAALVKLFPAVVGLWLLRTRRIRAAAVAVATGVAGLLAGAVVFGVDTSIYYVTDVMAARGGSSLFVGGYPVDGTYYLTIQQPLSHLLWTAWPGAPYEAVAVLAVLVAIPVLAYFYRDCSTEVDRLMAVFATFVAMVVVFPALRWYVVLLYPPLVGLLYVWESGPGRRAFLAGGVALSATVRSGDVVEWFAWLPSPLDGAWFAIGGSAVPPLYGLAVMVAACGWYKHRTGGRAAAEADAAGAPTAGDD